MKRFLIWSLVAAALVLLPTVIGKFRFPATLKSVPSADGKFVAEICWVPASRSVWLSWFDVLVPTASRMFAVVREPKGEALFWVPLDLANDAPEDYASASIVWTGGKAVFSSIRAAEVRIDVILGTVQTVQQQKPNQSLEPTTLLGTSAAEQPLVPSRVVAHL